jgi:hypothetical protein
MTSVSPSELQRAKPASPFRFEMASEADDAALRQLLRETPMDGRIRVTLEREPGFFAAASIEGEPHHAAVARDATTGEIVGMGSRSVREVFVNGQPVLLGYLSQLRVHPRYRVRSRELLRGGFGLLRSTRTPDETPFDITTIIADNHAARRLLETGLPGLPTYRKIEPFVTLLIPCAGVKHVWSTAFRRHWERGRPRNDTPIADSRIADIVDCLERNNRRHQFAPRWTTGNFCPRGLELERFHVAVKGGRAVGCLAIWDQRTFKQAVVHGYGMALARWRRLLNLFGARLPVVGEALPMAFVSHLAVDDDDPAVFEDLLASAVTAACNNELQWLAVGLAARHPLVQVARRRFRPREYESILYVVHDPDAEIVLDNRVPHLEVALL